MANWWRGVGAAALAVGLLTAASSRAAYRIERVVTGLNQPMFVAQAPGDSSSLYIVERQGPTGGAGRILKRDLTTGTNEVFLDFAGNAFTGDGGVLSMAFHPDFATNGKFYTATSFNGGVNNLRNRVQEYRVDNGTPLLQRTMLEYDNLLNPFHTLNMMAFNPLATGAERNYMTILVGDGGTLAESPAFVNHSQDLSQLYGKLLRVDVSDGADAYPADPRRNFGIPANNPYSSDGNPNTLDEIFASGIREPFRGSFDRANGDFYFGDVGNNTREELNFIKAGTSGQDFGWARREGTIQTPHPSGGPQGSSINPIYEFDHSMGNVSINGGMVYRGPATDFQGTYFFSDYVSGRIYTATFDRNTNPASFSGSNLANVQERRAEFESKVAGGADIRYVTAFNEDLAGNMYLVKFGNGFFPPNGQGEIFRIVPGMRSDFDLDDDIDVSDWTAFLAFHKSSFTGLTPDQAYARGDLDGDFDNDFRDFLTFRTDYDVANGPGSFARLASVPEPSAAALAAIAACLCMRRAERVKEGAGFKCWRPSMN